MASQYQIERLAIRYALIVVLSFAAATATFAPASAQVPTPSQRQALRSNCVSDYRANCATVPTGGMAALVCLEQHVDKLSPACKSAVLAAEGQPAPAAAAPAAAEKPAPSNKEAKKAIKPPSTPAPAAADTTAEPPPRHVLPFFLEVRIAARACATDFRLLCPGVPLGHGNAIFCLKVHAHRLDPACRNALIAAGERLE
jgi:hypothetical protein